MAHRPTLTDLAAAVAKQADALEALRAALAVQFTRMAQMQAELDRLPSARRTRLAHLAVIGDASIPTNGHGRVW